MAKRKYVKRNTAFWQLRHLNEPELTKTQIQMIAVVHRCLNNKKTMSRAEAEARALVDIVSVVK